MKNKSVALKSLILFAIMAVPQTFAQRNPGFKGPAEIPSRQQAPVDRTPLTFSSKAQYVLVPVIVQDKSKAPVKGLKKEDFTVLENGKSQPISSVEEINTAAAPIREEKTAEEFSNGLDSGGQARRVTVIALDLINTPVLDQTYARKSIMKMLANAPDDGSLIELITIHGKGMTVIHSFTDDPKSLIAAMKLLDAKYTGTESFKNQGLGDELRRSLMSTGKLSAVNGGQVNPLVANSFQRMMSFATGADGQYLTFQRDAAVTATLMAFQRVAGSLESLPGRKSLVWVSAGFPFFVDSETDEIMGGGNYANYERTMHALDNANIAVYPVDARGLSGIQADDSNRYATGDVSGTEDQVNQLARDHNATLDTMRNMADMTGGKAFFNRNDVGNLVAEAIHDSSDYYLLSFPLNTKDTRPGWRKLDVKVKGGGMKIRARRGYFVTRATLQQFEAKQPDLESALASPLEFTGLPIRARWLGTPSPGTTGKVVQFELDIPANAISPQENENKVSLDFRVSAVNPKGEPKGDVKQTFEGTLPPAGAEQLKKEGVKYKSSFELVPGEYTVHFVVRDNITGKLGSVIAQLTIG